MSTLPAAESAVIAVFRLPEYVDTVPDECVPRLARTIVEAVRPVVADEFIVVLDEIHAQARSPFDKAAIGRVSALLRRLRDR